VTEQEIRAYQLRALIHELYLLEGHLGNFQPGREKSICCHCSSKHTMGLEALAEEGVSVLNDLAPLMRRIALWAGQHEATFQRCDLDEPLANQLAAEVRGFRKELMTALERVATLAPAQPGTSGPEVSVASSFPLHLGAGEEQPESMGVLHA
jgi:hypothetical protein